MKLKDFCFDGKKKLELKKMETGSHVDKAMKQEIIEKTMENQLKIQQLQDKLYAEGRESLIIVFQAMDAAGKDSTIKHVMGGVNPQGVRVHSFKQPCGEEMAHDYLWRVVKELPPRGEMAIFNRSHYEDVLVVKVHNLHKGYKMAKRCLEDKDFFEKRYRQIRGFEGYLYENSYRMVKIFLNLSYEKQRERFLERIQIPEKNWKFSVSDVRERRYWDKYAEAYEDAINATATPESPWYVLPADRKWYTRYLVSQAILEALEEMNPQYPVLDQEHQKELSICEEHLLSEDK